MNTDDEFLALFESEVSRLVDRRLTELGLLRGHEPQALARPSREQARWMSDRLEQAINTHTNYLPAVLTELRDKRQRLAPDDITPRAVEALRKLWSRDGHQYNDNMPAADWRPVLEQAHS